MKIINSLLKLEADIIICNVLVRANTAEFITNRRTTWIFALRLHKKIKKIKLIHNYTSVNTNYR